MKKVLMGMFLLLLPGLWLMAEDTGSALRVQVQDDTLILYSEGAPLSGVLWAISAQTDIRLSIMGEMPSEGAPVVEDFADLSVEDGVIYLLEQYLEVPNYTLVTDAETGRLATVHIMADAFGEAPDSSAEDSSELAADDDGQPVDDEWDMLAEDEATDPLDEAITAALEATDPDAQVDALQALGNYDDPRTLEVLQPALLSGEPKVRQAALETIPWTSTQAASALEDVRAMAAEDPEPAVRQSAVMILTRHDDTNPATRTILESMLKEERLRNRDFFQRELERIDEEAAARGLPDTQGDFE